MKRSVALLISAALAAPACGGAPASGDTSSRVIEIRMTDFAFVPARLVLRPGDHVTLRLRNDGTAEHEVMAGTGAMADGYMTDWLAGALVGGAAGDHAGHTGVSVRVPAHATASVDLVVPPLAGELEFACFVADHYERGMRGTILVDPGRAPNAVPTAGTGTSAPRPSGALPTAMPHASDDMGGMGDEGH